MRKITTCILGIVFVSATIFCLSSCSPISNNSNSLASTDSILITEDKKTNDTTVATSSFEAIIETPKNIYETSNFSFVIPESWTDKYETREVDGNVSFYAKNVCAAGEEGFLFSVNVFKDKGEWEYFPEYYYIGCADDTYYVLFLPTDWQCGSISKDLVNEYNEMNAELVAIENSFMLVGKIVEMTPTETTSNLSDASSSAPAYEHEIVDFLLDKVGMKFSEIEEDAKYSGAVLYVTSKEAVSPYLQFAFSDEEVFYIYTPQGSESNYDMEFYAVIDGIIVAYGGPNDTTNVYSIIKDSAFEDVAPMVSESINGFGGTNLTWEAKNGFLILRTSPISDDYKKSLVMAYSYVSN